MQRNGQYRAGQHRSGTNLQILAPVPDIQSQDQANSVSVIPSGGMLLQWPGEKRKLPAFARAFHATDKAIDSVLTDTASCVPDLGGKTGTNRCGTLIAQTLRTA